ncbi:hypothetical protein ACIRL2_26945 [Embleya sp. NPDC127516]|uniref:hypothetical protein n=1 Tax=Embleya sp. NPDC127516 TaxID=3363990 RepID=UPI003817B9A7
MGFVAQVRVPPSESNSYDWAGRTVEHHRAQIREHLGFHVRPFGEVDLNMAACLDLAAATVAAPRAAGDGEQAAERSRA